MTEEKEVSDTNGQEKKEEVKSSDDISDLEGDIIRQVEYYFGDVNMSRDKFLREQSQLDEGWVPFDVLLKFNRLSKMSTDIEFIAQALLKSTSGLLEVSDDNKKVRRSPDLPVPEMNEERRKELTARTVYVKGFPKEAQLDELLKFFQQHEVVETVMMRRYQDRQTKKKMFKGSVYVIFKTREQAEKFVGAKDEMKYNDNDLLVLWQSEYLEKKQEEYTARKLEKDKGKEKKEEVRRKEDKPEFKLPTGSCFKFSEPFDTMSREDVKDALTALGVEVAFIDFRVGETEGWVRLTKENAAIELNEKITDGKIKIKDKDVVFKLLEGEEETAYLNKSIDEMAKLKSRRRNQSRQNRGRGAYRGKPNLKRKLDDDDGPPCKKAAES